MKTKLSIKNKELFCVKLIMFQFILVSLSPYIVSNQTNYINRIKVMFVEKKKQTSGLQSDWGKLLQLFPNGAQTAPSHHLRPW